MSIHINRPHIICMVPVLLSMILILAACGGPGGSGAPETEFTVKDLREVQGNRVSESFNVENGNSTDILFQDMGARRDFRHLIDLNLTSNKVDSQKVRDRIYQFYKVSDVNNSKLCLVPVEVPPSSTYQYDLEWIEILHEGVIEEGKTGGGQQLGTYNVLISWNCQVVGVRVL